MTKKEPRRIAPVFPMKKGETMEDVLLKGARLEKRVEDLESRFAELERNVRKPLTDSVEVPARPADALTESEVAFLRGFARSR